jgi:hypothetical protein
MTTARANERLARLLDSEDEALSLVQSVQRRIGELEKAIANNPTGDNAGGMRKELLRFQEKQSECQTRHAQRAALNAQVRQWLSRIGPNKGVEDVKLLKAKVKAGETHADAVDRARADISTLLSERLNVQQCGLPIAEMKAQARKFVTEKAIRGRPRIKADHEAFSVNFVVDTWTAKIDFQDVLSWFDPEAMVQRLEKEIDLMPVAKLALTPTKKAERLADIKSKLLELERLEEAHIEAAEQNDQSIPRRPNADPAALLGIIIKRKADLAA